MASKTLVEDLSSVLCLSMKHANTANYCLIPSSMMMKIISCSEIMLAIHVPSLGSQFRFKV